jgi:hypothetical protein
MLTTLIAQMSDLLAPISKSRRARSRPVPMGLWAVTRWCEGCRSKGKVQARLGSRPNFRTHRAGSPNPVPPRSNPGVEKQEFQFRFQYDMAESQSPLILLPFLLPTLGKPQFQPRECVTAWVEPHPPISLSRATINPKARPMTLKNAMPRNMRCMF